MPNQQWDCFGAAEWFSGLGVGIVSSRIGCMVVVVMVVGFRFSSMGVWVGITMTTTVVTTMTATMMVMVFGMAMCVSMRLLGLYYVTRIILNMPILEFLQ